MRKGFVAALLTVALTVQGLALWWLSSVQGLLAAIPPVILMGLSASAFIPVMQATISDRVPFHRRGRVLAVVEFSWAITGLVVLPLVGLLLVRQGWQAPLRLVAVLSLLVSPLPWLLPARRQSGPRIHQGLLAVSRTIWHNSSARAAILVNGLIFVAAESFFVTYGAWLEQDFGLAPDQIGRVAALLGLAELSASGLSSLIIDHVGKRRGVGAGILAMALTMAALPLLARSLVPAAVAMFAFTMSFEFTIVSNIGLMSEQVPPARGTVLALGVMVGGIVRTLSDFLGLALFEWRGIEATVVYGVMGSVLAAFVLYRWVREPEDGFNGPAPLPEYEIEPNA